MEIIEAKLNSMKGWLKFLGILSIIGGALYVLTIVGILFAWLPIWLGVVLYQAGDRAEQYAKSKDEGTLGEFFAKLNTYFTVLGVVALISIAFTVLGLVLVFTAGISLPHYFSHYHWKF